MCSRNLLFRDVSFIRRYLLFTPRLLGPIPGASFSLSCVLLLLLLLPSTMHRVIAHQPTNQPTPAMPLPCLACSVAVVGRGREKPYVRDGTEWTPWRTSTPGPLCLLLVHQRGREALKLARSNELTSELYLCVHNYKKYVLSRSMDISEHNF